MQYSNSNLDIINLNRTLDDGRQTVSKVYFLIHHQIEPPTMTLTVDVAHSLHLFIGIVTMYTKHSTSY